MTNEKHKTIDLSRQLKFAGTFESSLSGGCMGLRNGVIERGKVH